MTRETDPRARFARVAATIRVEMDALDAVVAEAELALASFSERTPSGLELRGVGAIVHDFYTGAERIFERIAPEINGGIPAGAAWHRELVDSMALDLPGIRPPVIGDATADRLAEFLRFRHLFRNLYGHELEWLRLRPLVTRLPGAWHELQSDLRRFLQFLDAGAR
jgi:hypothetical protein